jgi:hypothetical protein
MLRYELNSGQRTFGKNEPSGLGIRVSGKYPVGFDIDPYLRYEPNSGQRAF